MKRYEKYKDSGIEWIGEIPEGWECKRLRYLVSTPLQYGASESGDTEHPEYPRYIRITDITEDGHLKSSDIKYLEPSLAEPYMLKKGDILFARSGATVGKTYLFSEDIPACFAGYLIKASCNDKLFSKFLFYFTQSAVYYTWRNSMFTQATIQNIGADKYNELNVTVPTLSEQQAIASYLDNKVGQIDATVSAINTQIEDLKAYRQSVISEAVTKGLNPNVEMKDSGIEWIGKIPGNWLQSKLKFEVDMVLGKMLEDKEPTNNDGDYTLEPYLKSRNIGMLEVYNDIKQVDTMWFSTKEKIQYELKEGDLVMNEGGEIGKVSLWKNPGFKCYIQNSVHKITPHFYLLNSTYLQYLIFHITTKGYFNTIVSSISIAHLTKEKLADTPILLPPLSEQQAIAEYLDEKTSKIDVSIKSLEAQREDLKVLKQSIISEAVTGKIDVRNWKQNN